ncbi:hypothetical protein EV279_0884 [Microbacterium sp. BK668]|nr:hypothetical protein EV279_0884 [Microbacterium sp. BK668]
MGNFDFVRDRWPKVFDVCGNIDFFNEEVPRGIRLFLALAVGADVPAAGARRSEKCP